MILSADCPDGWEVKPEFGKCYHYIEEPMTWSEANERCAALDPDNKATLTSVQSQEENNYILSLTDIGPWLGGTDKDEEGVWRWVNSNITLSKSITCSPISWSFGCFVRPLCYSSAKVWIKRIRSKGGCMNLALYFGSKFAREGGRG